MTDASDTRIKKLRNHGQQALAEAFSQYHDRLQRIVGLRLDPRLRGRIDASDVLQDTFLEARKRLPRYLNDPGAPVFVWLRGIALDTLISVQRRHFAGMRDKRREISPWTPQSSLASLSSLLVAELTSPSLAAMREELAAKLESALESLDEIDRDVLIMRHFEELSNDEVACIIGVKKAAASRRYTRALRHLHEIIKTLSGLASGG
jgi:RNA polymerase sigma-70 factor (ECF subfamily)